MNKLEYAEYLKSNEWKEISWQVRKRAGYHCERCERNHHEHIHHLTYKNVGHEEPEDLLAVCKGCHEFLHGLSDYDPKEEREYRSVEEANAELVFVNGWWRRREEI